MSKRVNETQRRVVVRGVGASASPETVQAAFGRCGRVEVVRFLPRRTCLVQFESPDSVPLALELNNSRIPQLGFQPLNVQPDYPDSPAKKPRNTPGAFFYPNPAKYNNYMVPMLPFAPSKSPS